MTALPKLTYRVWLNPQDSGDPAEHEVTIRHVDRIMAERAAVGSLPMGTTQGDLPMAMMTSWVWAACKREGIYDGPLARFTEVDLLEMEPVESDEVDPTRPDPRTGSPSS